MESFKSTASIPIDENDVKLTEFDAAYGPSLVSQRNRIFKKYYHFDCACSQCTLAEADAKKHGFDPQISFHCPKPTCQGLIPLPLNPEFISKKTAALKCNDCGYVINPNASENQIRQELQIQPDANANNPTYYNGKEKVSANIKKVRRLWATFDESAGLPLLTLLENADKLCEYFEHSIIFSRPYEFNWEYTKLMSSIFLVYSNKSLFLEHRNSWKISMSRFEKMKRLVPLYENFFRPSVENDGVNCSNVHRLLTTLDRLIAIGKTMLEVFVGKAVHEEFMKLIEELFVYSGKALDLAKIVFGPESDPKRFPMILRFTETQRDLRVMARYYTKKYKREMPKELHELLQKP